MTYKDLFYLVKDRLDDQVYIEFGPDDYKSATLLVNKGESELLPEGTWYLTSLE